jgi:hypothetical protein
MRLLEKKGEKMRRLFALSVASLAVVFTLSYAIPALGGPQALSSANPVKIAKKALKRAKKADKRARQAQASVNQVNARVSRAGAVLAANVQTVSASITIPAQTVGNGSVDCPPGTVVLSGGYVLTGAEASSLSDHKKPGAQGWEIGVDNALGTTPASLTVEAQCAGTGNAVLAP